MKKNMLLMLFMVFFLGCETGTRYDANATTQTLSKNAPQSVLVDRDDIEALLDDREEVLEEVYSDERSYIEKEPEEEEYVNSFSNTTIVDGLDVRYIREGKHENHIRLVFDVYDNSKPASAVGYYEVKYNNSKKDIAVILHGYRKFSASLPSFPYYSVIEQIYFEKYPDDSGFKFHIKLRKNAKVKVFDLKNPARLVFDIKPI